MHRHECSDLSLARVQTLGSLETEIIELCVQLLQAGLAVDVATLRFASSCRLVTTIHNPRILVIEVSSNSECCYVDTLETPIIVNYDATRAVGKTKIVRDCLFPSVKANAPAKDCR